MTGKRIPIRPRSRLFSHKERPAPLQRLLIIAEAIPPHYYAWLQVTARRETAAEVLDGVDLMEPAAALKTQIERYRAMTGEERVSIALELHELACDVAKEGIRAQHPGATPTEIEDLLRKRIELTRRG